MTNNEKLEKAYNAGLKILTKLESLDNACERSFIKRTIKEGEDWISKVCDRFPKGANDNINVIMSKMSFLIAITKQGKKNDK